MYKNSIIVKLNNVVVFEINDVIKKSMNTFMRVIMEINYDGSQ